VTKDQPRNRPGGTTSYPGKSSGFRGKQGKPPWERGKGRPGTSPHAGERREAAFEEGGEVWIWGMHAAAAALANPRRRISEAVMTRNAAQRINIDPDTPPAFAQVVEPRLIDHRLPAGAVHQGLAVKCAPLEPANIEDAAMKPERPLVILDQVTDPQNVGAIFRSAAAFGLGGVVLQTRNAPLAGGALAKAAAGAVETLDEIRVVNIARAIDALTDAGWNVVGLDGSADAMLEEAISEHGPLAIVMGAEGAGLRPAVAAACSRLARIPIHPGMESLNVSNAAAIAFYEAGRRNPAPPPAAPRAADRDAAETESD
jgi:23S rRNA (guanosine2251-2'-O)-methyltransferase